MTKPRKVLYVSRTSTGGAAFSLYYLIEGLDRSRYEPIVLFYTQKNTYIEGKLAELGVTCFAIHKGQLQTAESETAVPISQRDIAGWLEAHVGKWANYLYTFARDCYQFVSQDLPKTWAIVLVIWQNDIELVHVNDGLRHSKPSIIAAWLTRVFCICHVRMFADLHCFDKIFARLVDFFIYISRAIADNYISQGISPSQGIIVHNGVDLRKFLSIFDIAAVRREFNWSTNELLVGVVGRLDWWKGHEYFLEAIAKLIPEHSNLRGIIVGQPETSPINQQYYQKLQNLTKSLGLEDKVIFTGFRSDIPRLMSALDVIVLSSSSPEPFGRVVIEGMAAGKPVIATAAGGVPDMIKDGVNGLLVPCKDSQAIARAINWLLSNPEKAERIGVTARQCVAENFTVKHYVDQVQNIYDFRFTSDYVTPLEAISNDDVNPL